MKNQKSYDEYLDDMSYLFKQKKKFGTRAELKAWLEKNKIDRPSDTRNAVTSNNMNKITSTPVKSTPKQENNEIDETIETLRPHLKKLVEL